MYTLIDESNISLPAEITESDYLLLPVQTQALYHLECGDDHNILADQMEGTQDLRQDFPTDTEIDNRLPGQLDDDTPDQLY